MGDIEVPAPGTADTETPSTAWRTQAAAYVGFIRTEADRAPGRPTGVDGGGAGASFDRLASAATELQRWLAEEPGGDSDLVARLDVLAARYRFTCLSAAGSSDGGGTEPGVTVDRLKSLDSEAGELLESLGRHGGDAEASQPG